MSDIPPPEIIIEKFLPFELVENILSRLPVKSLKRFRAVEKSWCRLIDSEKFAKKHLQRSQASNSNRNLISGWLRFHWLSLDSLEKTRSFKLEFEYDTKDMDAISNSCNGLVVVKRRPGPLIMLNPLILFNPFTREYKVLPFCPFHPRLFLSCKVTYGFGYDSKNDDYKIVKSMLIEKPFNYDSEFEEWVYSLRSDCWRKIDGTYYDRENWPIHVNGALHTAVQTGPGIGDMKIKCFSVETEKGYEVARPEGIDMKDVNCMCLDVFDGYLAIVCFYPSRVVIWVMEEYGVKESWVELISFTVGKGGVIRPIAYVDGRDKILVNHNCERLVLLGVRKESFELFEMPERFPFVPGICVETLVSPHGWAKKNGSAEKHLNKKTKKMMVKKRKKRGVVLSSRFKLALRMG